MSEFLWQNDKKVDAISLTLPHERTSAGFWLGDGLFETMLVHVGKVFAKERHLRRLAQARERLGLADSQPEMSNNSTEAWASNLETGIAAATEWLTGRMGQIRITYLSSGDLIITAREHHIPESRLRLISYPFPRSERSALSGMKTVSYGENALALRFAKDHDRDDVLFFNSAGAVMESALANLLLWDGSQWWTPSLASGCLPGVTRELLIEFFSVKERDFLIDDLLQVKAMALTSSLRDIQAVSLFQESSYSDLSEVDRLRLEFQEWRAKNFNP